MTDPKWRKSTRSAQTDCVEVALQPNVTLIRDSKDPHAAHLSIALEHWHSFLTQLKTDHRCATPELAS